MRIRSKLRMPGRQRIFKVLAVALLSFLLEGCGPRLVKGPAETPDVPAPDSLKAKFSLEMIDSVSGSHKLSGVLFAVPYERYRFEFSGPMGIGIASLLWNAGEWTLLLPQQKAFASGRGYLVGGYAGIPLFDVHRIASLFWGNVLPRGTTVDSSRTVSGKREMFGRTSLGIPFFAVCDTNGRIARISEGAERLEFMDYAEFGGVVAPSKATVYRREGALNFRLKSVKPDAEWGRGIWRLPIPEDYDRLDD